MNSLSPKYRSGTIRSGQIEHKICQLDNMTTNPTVYHPIIIYQIQIKLNTQYLNRAVNCQNKTFSYIIKTVNLIITNEPLSFALFNMNMNLNSININV